MPPDPQTPPPPDPTEDAEKAFWEKFTGTMDSWWDNKMKSYQDQRPPNTTGTSRTGGKRTTLPGLIADMVFGPEKSE
jgi:hypothetical protein